LALGLAVVGIYGVVSFSTRRRTPEIGLRVALGASNARILALAAGSSLTHALAGIGIGLGASALLARSLRTMLYGVPTHDPAAYAAAVALLLLAAVTAAIPPALAALRIDPTAALRTE
jgi:ABC-type antimicrobial peptide transport system permease subunit